MEVPAVESESNDSGSSSGEEGEAWVGEASSEFIVGVEGTAGKGFDEVVASTNKDSTRVSRIVWEVIRTSDAVIREPYAVQVDTLLTKMADMRVDSMPVPHALQMAHRHLLKSHRFRQFLDQMETALGATSSNKSPTETQSKSSAVDEQHALWYRYHMYKHYEQAIALLQTAPLRPVAASWHNARRALILSAHGKEVTALMGDDVRTPVAMVAIVTCHLYVAINLQHLGGSTLWGWSCAFVAAALVGGFCAFGFQALDHELSHFTTYPRAAAALGLVGSGCTTVPWFSYYHSGGHARHHKYAGTPRDIDREAFFWAWERTPPWLEAACGESLVVFSSVLWASMVGLGLPLMYVASLLYCLLGNWRANTKELAYFAADSSVTFLVHAAVTWMGGSRALVYLILSMAFGNGFLMHPLIGFWLMQHLCHSHSDSATHVSMQPTVSYTGSWFWNLLNFNQLSHTEHHDFSRISWANAPALRSAAKEFYEPLESIPSLSALLWHWVTTRGNKLNFACIGAPLPSLPPIPELPHEVQHLKAA